MTIYFHKTSVTGLLNLLFENHSEWLISFSTEESTELLSQGWRNVCVVIDTDKIPESYSLNDIDAHSVTSWDEARIRMSKDEFVAAIKGVVISKEDYRKPNFTMPGKLWNITGGYSVSDVEKETRKLLKGDKMSKIVGGNFNIVSSTQAKKIHKMLDEDFMAL